MVRVSARRLWAYVALFGIIFQAVHFLEHGLQLGYWILNPAQAPWLTPWAAVGRDLLVVDAEVATGNELLHLVGNGIFMAGLVGLCMVARCLETPMSKVSGLTKAVRWQAFHLGEHVMLSGTQLLLGSAIGVSTLFGLLGAGPLAWSYRVWLHFLINLVATIYGVRALRHEVQDDMLLPSLGRSPRMADA